MHSTDYTFNLFDKNQDFLPLLHQKLRLRTNTPP